MRFFSDNAAAAHPAVIEAIATSNRLDTAYDGDALSAKLDGAFSDLFETEVRAFWVLTGTAANCLALATLCPGYGGIICHKDAHIEVDEAGAPAFFADGAKLMLVDGEGAKVSPQTVDAGVGRVRKDVHQVQPKALSITNATEYGLVYSAAEVAALGDTAKRQGLAFHMDGARFGNAVVSTGASPADISWTQSPQKFCQPRTKFLPPLSNDFRSTSGLVAAKLEGDSTSSICRTENSTIASFCFATPRTPVVALCHHC